MVPARPGRGDDLELRVARRDPLAVRELTDEVRQVVARPGPGEDRQVEAERESLGAGRVVRVDVGQGDRHEAAAVGGDRAEDRVRGGVRRIARVDHDDLALPDEVGVRGLTGHGARGADDDPGQPRPLPDDARRGRRDRA